MRTTIAIISLRKTGFISPDPFCLSAFGFPKSLRRTPAVWPMQFVAVYASDGWCGNRQGRQITGRICSRTPGRVAERKTLCNAGASRPSKTRRLPVDADHLERTLPLLDHLSGGPSDPVSVPSPQFSKLFEPSFRVPFVRVLTSHGFLFSPRPKHHRMIYTPGQKWELCPAL